MAKQVESTASWADVVKELIKSFMVLRDLFGYALPGAVFLGVGVIAGRLRVQELHDLLLPYTLPAWATGILVVSTCYAVGQILATIAYLRVDLWKSLLALLGRRSAWARRKLEEHPTEVHASDLYYRGRHPEFFYEKDRRETMALLAFSLAAALLLGWLVFCELQVTFCRIVLWAGVFVFLDTLTAMAHLRRVRGAVHQAAVRAQGDPPDSSSPGQLAQQISATLIRIAEILKGP